MRVFYIRLKKILIEKGMSKSTLARLIGVKPQTIINYCANRRFPNMDRMYKICLILNVSSDYFYGIKTPPRE